MNNRIACSEPIDQLIRRHAKTISTPKHHFHPKELQTLAMLDDMLSMLGEKYPKQVFPTFDQHKQVFPTFDQQWRAEKTHYALAGFHVRDQAVVAGLAKYQIVGKCDAEGMYQFDAGAIEALRTMHLVAQCQRGHAFELAKLTQSSSLTSDATRTSALKHWLPQKLKQLVALKESMGAAASGVTVHIGVKDNSYSIF
jgi:3-oxoacyl-ACP reductase-like protein